MRVFEKGAPMSSDPRPPRGLGAAGRRLWRSILAGWDLNPAELATLADACATADLVERLQEQIDAAPDLTEREARRLVAEVRQQRLCRARLVAALRLPDEDPAARTQVRSLRGPYRRSA
jgi:hypothetical protein